MKRILLYCDHWQNGGVEAYLMNQLRRWDLTQMKCSLLTAEKTTDIYDAELSQLGVVHHVLLEGENHSPIARILSTFSRFEAYLRAHPCDVLYLNLSNSVTMRYAKIAKKLGIPRRIVHSHCSGVQPGKTRALKLLGHRMAREWYSPMLTDWWACSDKAAEFLFSSRFLSKVVYIPNAIDTKKFQLDLEKRKSVRSRLGLSETTTVIGTVGRLSPEKNQCFLLDVFALFNQQNPDSRLLLVGDGPLRAELEERAGQLGIAESCIFYGFTDDAFSTYCAMDVFCLPSVLEGNPVSAIEAQANGLPCLLADTITRQAGLVQETEFLPLEDKAEWVTCLERFVASRGEPKQREHVGIKPEFNIKSAAKRVENLLINNGVS